MKILFIIFVYIFLGFISNLILQYLCNDNLFNNDNNSRKLYIILLIFMPIVLGIDIIALFFKLLFYMHDKTLEIL
jgi:ABC-type phosphate/phosphonate transport system permease subunit